MIELGFVLLILVLFLSRTAYRISHPDDITRDAYAHLKFIRDIRNHNHTMPEEPSGLTTGGRYSYPFFMHWLLSFTPRSTWPFIERYFSGIMDVIFTGYFLILGILGYLTDFQILLCLLIFITTPEFARADQSHGKGLTARKPGMVLVTGSFLWFLLWFNGGGIVFLFLSFLFGALVALTSKFGLQALMFISIGIGILVSPIALFLPILSVAIAFALSFGEYKHVFRTHIRHSYRYAINYDTYHPGSTVPSIQGTDIVERLRNILQRDISKEDLWHVREQTAVRILVNNPFILVYLLAIGQYFTSSVTFSTSLVGLNEWVYGGLAAFIFTALPPFRFLGEAERYLEYAFLPMVLIIAESWQVFGSLFKTSTLIISAGGMTVLFLYMYLYEEYISTSDSAKQSWNEMIDFLNKQNPGTLIVQPRNKSRGIVWETDHDVVDVGLNTSSTEEVVKQRERIFSLGSPHITDDIDWLDERYSPDFVVFDKEYEPFTGLQPLEHQPRFENSYYKVYEFDSY